MSFLLDEFGLKEYATKVIVIPTNPQQLATYKKENAKAIRIILDEVNNNIVPRIA